MGMWLHLFMANSIESILNVARHGKIYLVLFVVPVKCEAKESCAFPVGVNFVVLLEDAHKMFNLVFVDVLHAKIVDNKGEAVGVPVMMPVSWCDCALLVSCFGKVFGEEFLRNDAGLWEAVVHPTLHFAANIAFCVRFVAESIFIDDVLWEEFKFYPRHP